MKALFAMVVALAAVTGAQAGSPDVIQDPQYAGCPQSTPELDARCHRDPVVEKTPQQIISEDFTALAPPSGTVLAIVPYLECNGGPCPFMVAVDDKGIIINSPVPLTLYPKEWSAMAQDPTAIPLPRPRPWVR
jgi:hypothetical protein